MHHFNHQKLLEFAKRLPSAIRLNPRSLLPFCRARHGGPMRILFRLGLIVCIGVISSCSWLIRPPIDDPEARLMVQRVMKLNRSLSNYKELATFRLQGEHEVRSGSLALAAARPDRMRVELLSLVGQPLTQLVADGQNIYIRPHGKDRIYRISQSPSALETLIQIPIGVEQLQGILVGNPGLSDFDAARFIKRSAEETVIELKNRFHMKIALLDVDPIQSKLKSVQVHGEDGEMIYRADFRQWQQVGSYLVPKRLIIKSAAGHQLTIFMRQFWPNATLSEAAFVLEDPQSEDE